MPEFRKRPRQRLDADVYNQVRLKVLERDGWRCQICGRRTLLDIHHIDARARGGDDGETNLLTLCRMCHQGTHVPMRNRQI